MWKQTKKVYFLSPATVAESNKAWIHNRNGCCSNFNNSGSMGHNLLFDSLSAPKVGVGGL